LHAEEASDAIFGRVCVAVHSRSIEGNVSTKVFSDDSRPGEGKQLEVYFDAVTDGTVLIVAINPTDQTLANGWLPQTVAITAWEEYQIPQAGNLWQWQADSDPFEIYVLFFPVNWPDPEGIFKLAQAMQAPEATSKLLDLQTKKLYQQIVATIRSGSEGVLHSGAATTAWGGTLRGSRFHWKHSADKVALHPDEVGHTVYRYEAA